MSLLEEGYKKFEAEERAFNDGKEDCGATLEVEGPEINGSYAGSTTKQNGHAEMDALTQFLQEIKWKREEFDKYSVTITCKDKPCCVRCSAILGHLGISPGAATFKSPNTMGKTGYSVHPNLRKFLAGYLGCKEEKVNVDILGWAT